jgi:hypothetical protein
VDVMLERGKRILGVLDVSDPVSDAVGAEPKPVVRIIEAGFLSLPAGCSMQLDRVVSETVVENIKVALTSLRRAQLAAELRAMGDVSLAEFLHRSARSLEDVYRSGRSWTELRRMAGFVGPAGPDEAVLGEQSLECSTSTTPNALPSTAVYCNPRCRLNQTSSRMLHFDLWGRQRKFTDLDEALASGVRSLLALRGVA